MEISHRGVLFDSKHTAPQRKKLNKQAKIDLEIKRILEKKEKQNERKRKSREKERDQQKKQTKNSSPKFKFATEQEFLEVTRIFDKLNENLVYRRCTCCRQTKLDRIIKPLDQQNIYFAIHAKTTT